MIILWRDYDGYETEIARNLGLIINAKWHAIMRIAICWLLISIDTYNNSLERVHFIAFILFPLFI